MIHSILLAAFTLVGADQSAKVVISENAEPSTRLCVEELTNYVAKISGEILKVEKVGGGGQWRQSVDAVAHRVIKKGDSNSSRRGDPPRLRDSIIIGILETLGDAVPAAARKALAARSEDEAFWCGTADGNLWIVGKNETADLRGTYWFLEHKLGVRWFKIATKDDPGDYVPAAKTLALDDFAECRAPRFMIRRLDQTGSWGSHIPREGMRLANRLGFQTYPAYGAGVPYDKPDSEFYKYFAPRVMRKFQPHGGAHSTISDIIAPNKYYDAHPEYFALIDGKRRKGGFYCLTNPDVLRLTAEGLIARFKKDHGLGQFTFGQVDSSHGFCQCDRCRAAAGKGAAADDVSRSFGLFVKEVAARIWAQCPNAQLNLWAYNTYRRYTGIEQDPRMRIWYCTHGRCHAHALDDPSCPENAKMFKEIESWHTPGREIFFYDYLTCAPIFYTCNEAIEAHDIKLYDKMGYVGWKNESPYSDAKYNSKNTKHPEVFPSNWQWLYVTGHLLLDPKQNWEELLADAESKYYGPAYPVMKKYHAERRRLWAKPGPCMGYPRGDSRRPLLLSEKGAKEKLLGFLAESEKLVDAEAKTRQPVDAEALRVTQKGDSASERRGKDSASTGRGEPPRLQGRGKDSASTGRGEPPRLREDVHSPTPTPNSNSIYKSRLALDRKWLTEYWIKPNDRIKEEEKRAIKIGETKDLKVTIDGVGDEPAWANAPKQTEFTSTTHAEGKLGKPFPPSLATEVKVLRDAKNFYLLCTALEPKPEKMKMTETHDGPVWEDDHFEFMFAPPVIDCRYYQVCVNAKGVIYDASYPGGIQEDNFGVEAKGKILKDRYVVEMRVPVEKMHEFVPGEKWRMLFGRIRTILDELTPHHWERIYSVGSGGYHDTSLYTHVEIK